MIELDPHAFPSVGALFAPMDFHLTIPAVLAGKAPGQVYTSDSARPAAALLRYKHRYYLAGDPHMPAFNEALGRLFHDEIYPHARQSGQIMFTLSYEPAGWGQVIEAVLHDKYPMTAAREYYEMRLAASAVPLTPPQDFSLQPVDRNLLQREHLKNLDDLKEEMCSERVSVDDFLEKSFGICALYGEEIAGWCLSEYNLASRCEIGIATLPPYQRRGLGVQMTAAFVEQARLHDVSRVGWHCYASNIPSSATARKAGFEKLHDYAACFAWFNEVDNLGVHGNLCMEVQQYTQAAAWYEKALSRGEASGWVYFGAARAAAMLGDLPAAFRCLHLAVDHGFTDPSPYQASRHLEGLRSRPEWQALAQRLE